MSFSERRKKLWKDGQTTLAYVTREPSFSREQRFKHFSIYWPQKNDSNGNIHKQMTETDQIARHVSKLIDEEQKNEIRMAKTKVSSMRKISEKRGIMTERKDQGLSFRSTRISNLSKQNQQIMKRLTFHSEKKQSRLRDRHGGRTNIHQDQEDDNLIKLADKKQFRGTQTGFYTSRRIKLELPHNYYPGPGTYNIKRYLENGFFINSK